MLKILTVITFLIFLYATFKAYQSLPSVFKETKFRDSGSAHYFWRKAALYSSLICVFFFIGFYVDLRAFGVQNQYSEVEQWVMAICLFVALVVNVWTGIFNRANGKKIKNIENRLNKY